jgi:hypothetical protein
VCLLQRLGRDDPQVYEVDPMICPRCGGRMKVVAFLTEYAVIDRIIRHLELTFVAEKPPPAHVFEQTALMAAASACTHGDVYTKP